jgi:hypothetical protein
MQILLIPAESDLLFVKLRLNAKLSAQECDATMLNKEQKLATQKKKTILLIQLYCL